MKLNLKKSRKREIKWKEMCEAVLFWLSNPSGCVMSLLEDREKVEINTLSNMPAMQVL